MLHGFALNRVVLHGFALNRVVLIVDIIACVDLQRSVRYDMFAGTVIMLCAVVLAPIL